jgi:DNA-binding MarR family transcriptional regulator
MPRSGPLPVDPIAEAKRQWIAHGWTDAAPGMSAVTSIIRAQQLLLARIDVALKPFKLSFARYEMLRLLGFTREGRMPMASAIARLQVHPTSVTNTVDRLVRDGLVEREPHPGDGRAAMLVLTASGRELVEQATDALNTEVFADPGLSDNDTAELVAIIARLRKGAGDFTDPRPLPEPL